MSSQASDPCANYETDGQVDVGKLFDDVIALGGCLEVELNKLESLFGRWIAADVRAAMFSIQNARRVHADANKRDTPLE